MTKSKPLATMTPAVLKTLTPRELELLPYEIREFLLEKVSASGGHLASNLGVVELTIALHYVFSSPRDKIIWDVGHQTYVHKILTGRANRFDGLRQFSGLSGFPKQSESEHDIYDAGHASTSISVGLGRAIARDLAGEHYEVISVIGDGAMTGGVAYEGLNNVANAKTRMIVILNDNEMSIDQNNSGLAKHLARLRTSRTYQDFKKQLKKTLHGIPAIGESLYSGFEHIRDSVKYAVVPGAIFEEIGFTYLGPVDGHDLPALIEILHLARQTEGPVLIHAVTRKGKGYHNAEKNPCKYHGIEPFDPSTGCALSAPSSQPSYSGVFGAHLCHLASRDPRVIAVSAAMVEGTGLCGFREQFPGRLFDVGIAEQHAVSFAAGLAAGGMKPVVAIYSTFLQRAYDEILSDICLPGLPVLFMLDRAGVVGADGETHHGLFDLSYLTEMPGMTVLAPKDGAELEQMMDYALQLGKPAAIRYPRGTAWRYAYPEGEGSRTLADGSCEKLISRMNVPVGHSVTILAAGRMVSTALEVFRTLEGRNIAGEVFNARFIKPADLTTVAESIGRTGALVTIEDNVLIGGFGHTVQALLNERAPVRVPTLCLGWPDRFIPQGSVGELDKAFGLDAPTIAGRVEGFLNDQTTT